MTVIIGMHVPGEGIYMSADGLVVRGGSLRCPTMNKLRRHGDCILGAAGSVKGFSFLDNYGDDVAATLVRDSTALELVLPDWLKEFGYVGKDNDDGGTPCWGTSFLIASPMGLYEVDDELVVTRIPENTPWAIGCGADFALGAASVLNMMGTKPQALLKMATHTACQYDTHCGGVITEDFLSFT